MCGVIGYTSAQHRSDLGLIAGELLKTLEYRGYDSTGAAVQGESEEIVLRKGVGAPSVMVETLGIVGLAGSILCGQVRWATFGSVDDLNAQPHEVRCKTHIYGAHNGNVTNCDDLKAWLTSEGHQVVSDNDGEMVVHTVEHFFAQELGAGDRNAAMRRAIVKAGSRLKGSYAAVIVDPVSRTLWAIKQGSSLYFGLGTDENGGFAIASSDLSSVLKLTRVLVPMTEGDFIEYTPDAYRLFRVKGGAPIERQPARSRLQAKDAALLPQFRTYMEQEIAAQEETCRRIAALFAFRSAAATPPPSIAKAVATLRKEYDANRIRGRFRELTRLPEWHAAEVRDRFESDEAAMLTDLLQTENAADVYALDALIAREEAAEFNTAVDAFLDACSAALDRGGRVFFVCCGSSHHAALAGAVFFNELAHAEVVPVLPGDFRARFAASLRPTDVVVAISQSGETKDLIDVMNHVIATGLPIRRIAIVNNVSSTLGVEKCDTVLPLRCGPEIAVPATKSFMNQLAILYGLAARFGNAQSRLAELPALIRETLTTTADDVDAAARLLFLKPSMHILATRLIAVAKEGALKIREVVLNHTEGFEASEFKHGPNTILGVNTIFGIDALLRFACRPGFSQADSPGFTPADGEDVSSRADDRPTSRAEARPTFADAIDDYPLLFVTGPDATDVNLTVSQVNTHKIRGTTCVMVAEENAALRQAVTKPPADNPRYQSVYIPLPATGDNLLTIFTATVVLQRLALRMSEMKMEFLDRVGFHDHGVHPDVPKNVSKSITVD